MGIETNQQSPSRQRTSESLAFDQGYESGLRDAELRKHPAPTTTRGGVAGSNDCQLRAIGQEERIAELFKYHPPREDQLPKYDAIRTAAKHFAEILLKNTTYGADQADALRKLRECVMTANASVALDGLS